MARFAFLLICAALIVGCGNSSPTESNSATSTTNGKPVAGFTSLKIENIEPGKGYESKKGDVVIVLYRGTFTDGREFDGNMNEKFVASLEKPPYAVEIGVSSVIDGWQIGLVGVREGMVRKLMVPHKLAYGEAGQGDKIPPKSDMIFYLKILKVLKQGEELAIETKDTKVGTGATLTATSVAVMNYTGKLLNGQVFDERTNESLPMKRFHLGLKEAVVGMKVGGKRKVIIPPGVLRTAFSIPPQQFAEFEFELLSIK